MRMIRLAATTLVLLALAGCSLLPSLGVGDAAVRYPDGCAAYELSPRRCTAIVNAIAHRHDVDPASASAIWLLGDPGCGAEVSGPCARTTSFVVRVRLDFPDAPSVEDSQFCGIGGQYSLLCTEKPEVRLDAPMLNGYGDIPCANGPTDCASPVPTMDPKVASMARALRVPAQDIVVDRVGDYDVPLGQAVLPNGLLTETTFSLPDPHQTRYTLTDGSISLVVAGPDGKPIWNVYEQGWRDGVETVDVSLRFSIDDFEPGTVIRVRDVVVR